MAGRMKRAATPLVLVLAAGGIYAAPFADPFRPPREIEAPPASASATPASGPRLESVLIAPDRRIAVINGEQYAEGDRIGEGRVLRITESEVVIARAGREESLTLFPRIGRRAGRGEGK
jgi:MSHA biogenesis protein MshK